MQKPTIELLEGRCLPSTFTVTNTNDDTNMGSLRWAITQANATAGPNLIDFQIGTGAQSIAILSPLPAITLPVLIDGTTQPGFKGKPLIELNGSAAGIANGLDITAANCTVRGLVINRFQLSGIYIAGSGATGNVITGNYLGTDSTGTTAKPNGADGIQVDQGATSNTIGGTTAALRNLISGNSGNGVELDHNAAGNVIEGNHIGTSAAGTGALGNALRGVAFVAASDNTLGGSTASSANVIASNGEDGVYTTGNGVPAGAISWYRAEDSTSDTLGTNNGTPMGGLSYASGQVGQAFSLNGTEAYVNVSSSPSLKVSTALTVSAWINLAVNPAAGTGALGNHGNGISLLSASANVIGGTVKGAGNKIYDNGGAGGSVTGGTADAIRRNDIYANAGGGIVLSGGANNALGSPTLTAATNSSTSTTVQGTFTGAANTTYTIELFADVAADPSGFGQGQKYLTSVTVHTDGSGHASFSAVVKPLVPAGEFISATATDPLGDTSSFSQDVTVS
jgi:hypothetical protein